MPEVKPTHQTPDGSKWIKVETPWPAECGGSYWQRASTNTILWANAGNFVPAFGPLTPIPQPVVRYNGVYADGSVTPAYFNKDELLRRYPSIAHIVTISTIPGDDPVVTVEAVKR